MRRPHTTLLAALAVCGLALGCGAPQQAEPAAGLPDTAVSALAGGEVSLASLPSGKPLLLWFWAPW